MRLVPGRPDLNRAYLLAAWHQEADLVVAVCAFFGPCVVEQPVTLGDKLLGNDIFLDHSQVGRQPVGQKGLVDDDRSRAAQQERSWTL